ncbi:MAG: OmpA family protein [Bacteroidia bacterium]
MNKKIYHLLLASLTLATPSVFAQKAKVMNNYNWQFGVQSGVVGYFGDLGPNFSNQRDWKKWDKHPSSFGTSLSLEHRFSSALGFSANVFTGSFTANDRAYDWNDKLMTNYANFQRALNCRTEILDASVSAIYHFDNNFIIKRNARIAPFVSLGVGYTGWRVWADLYANGGTQKYFYWNDGKIRDLAENDPNAANAVEIKQDRTYETRVDGLNTEGQKYATQALMIPLTLGTNFRLSDRWNFQIAATAKYLFSDYLEDVSGKYLLNYESATQEYAANPSGSKNEYRGNSNGQNDMYGYVSVGLAYNFGMRIKRFRGQNMYSTYVPKTVEKPKENVLPETPVVTPTPATPSNPNIIINVPESKTVEKTTVVEKNLDTRFAQMEKEMQELGESQQKGDDSLSKAMQQLRAEMLTFQKEKAKMEASSITPSNENEELLAKMNALTAKMDSIKIASGQAPSMPQTINGKATEEVIVTQNGDEIEETIISTDAKGNKKVIKTKKKVKDAVISSPQNDAQIAALMKRIEKLEAALNTPNTPKQTKLDKAKEDLELRRISLENRKLKLEQRKLKRQNEPIKTATDQAVKEAELKEIEAEMAALNMKMDSVSTAVTDISKQEKEVKIVQAPSISSPNPITNTVNSPAPAMSAELQQQLYLIREQLAELKAQKNQAPVIVEKPVYIEKGSGTTITTTTPDYSSTLNRLESKLDQLNGKVIALENKPATVTTNTIETKEKTIQVDKQTEYITKTVGMRKMNVYFANGKSDIGKSDVANLDLLAKEYAQSADMRVMIRGYASKTGKAAVNQKLSDSRANKVRNYLISKGIPSNKITIESFGSETPVFNNELDRRVEIELMY